MKHHRSGSQWRAVAHKNSQPMGTKATHCQLSARFHIRCRVPPLKIAFFYVTIVRNETIEHCTRTKLVSTCARQFARILSSHHQKCIKLALTILWCCFFYFISIFFLVCLHNHVFKSNFLHHNSITIVANKTYKTCVHVCPFFAQAHIRKRQASCIIMVHA